MTQTGMWFSERPAGHWWDWWGGSGDWGGFILQKKAPQLAEVMDSWLHLRKWPGLDLL